MSVVENRAVDSLIPNMEDLSSILSFIDRVDSQGPLVPKVYTGNFSASKFQVVIFVCFIGAKNVTSGSTKAGL